MTLHYLMQARSSVSGRLVTWRSVDADWAGEGFPGPGTPQHIAATKYVGQAIYGLPPIVPTVAAIVPAYGPAVGSTLVTIEVDDAVGAESASVGGANLTSFEIVNTTHVRGYTQAHAAGPVDVTVTTSKGTSAVFDDGFLYGVPCTIIGLVSGYGSVVGGHYLVVQVDDSTNCTAISVGGSLMTGFAILDPTHVAGYTAAHATGYVDVVVTNIFGDSDPLVDGFAYLEVPVLVSMAPANISENGGDHVVILVEDSTGAISAAIDGVDLTSFAIDDATHVSGDTAAHAPGLVDVTVTNGFGTGPTIQTEYRAAPVYVGIDVALGVIASHLVVEVADSTYITSVDVCGFPLTSFAIDDATHVSGDINPSCIPGVGDVTVTSPYGSSTGVGVYEVGLAPVITTTVGSVGEYTGGDHVVIEVVDSTGATGMTFGGVAATGFAIDDATHVSGDTPAHADGYVDVVVSNAFGDSDPFVDGFQYQITPMVIGIVPAIGRVGTHVVIEVNNSAGMLVGLGPGQSTVCGQTLDNGAIDDATHISGDIGFQAPGLGDVVVENAYGSSAPLVDGFDLGVQPTIPASALPIDPTVGALAGGTHVVIEVDDSTGCVSAAMDGVDLTGFAIDDATHVSGDTAAHAAGAVDVTVTNAYGTSGFDAGVGGFTYAAVPIVLSITPDSDFPAGGAHVVIEVDDSTGATSASLGGSALTSFAIDDATHVSGDTSSHAAGVVGVTVTNGYGTSTPLPAAFTYLAVCTVVACTPSIGSTLGGRHVVITVDDSTGATSAEIDGVAITGFAIDDSTHVSGDVVAHAAGTVDVTVTNAAGTSAPLVGGFTYATPFDPTTFALSSYYRGRNFTALPWLGEASAGISGSYRQRHYGSDPTVSTPTFNGYTGAEYDRTQDSADGTAGTLEDMEVFVTNNAYTVSWLVDIMSAAVATGANPYSNSSLWSADAHWGWMVSATAQLSGQSDVVFDAAARTITRASGNFLTDGFVFGQTVYVRRTLYNDGFIGTTLASVSATVLTFNVGATGIVDETVLLAGNVCISSGPYKFTVFNYTGTFPKLEYAITPGVRWIYVRRLSSSTVEVQIDGVAVAPLSGGGTTATLAAHTGASSIAGRTNSNYAIRMDFVIHEKYSALVTQSDPDRDNYASYLNDTFGTTYF